MRRRLHLVARVLALGLLAVPAAWACCDLGGMDTHCSMHSMKESTGSGHEDMKVAPCHTGGERLSGGCCDPESISPPVVGKTERASALPAALEVDGRGVLAPPASVELGTQTEPPRSRLHDLGRYTLFSALLL